MMPCFNDVKPLVINPTKDVMNFKRILTAGTTGTAVMTLFSVLLSKAAKKNYTEPVILGQLINRVTPLDIKTADLTGWGAHWAMGLAFTAFYEKYLNLKKTNPSLANTLLFGTISGLTGIVVWHSTFKAHPNPPGVDVANFYKQLLIAHVVFGVGVALTYQLEDAEVAKSSPLYRNNEPYFI